MFKLSQRSLNNLVGVHANLRQLVEETLAQSPLDFGITEGVRTKARQAELVKEGKSQTQNSRHLTGHAIDFVVYINGEVNWDFVNYKKVADVFKAVAKELGYSIVWGGDWLSLDGPHIELDRKVYP